MRLTPIERATIRRTVAALVGDRARVSLFGSRVDDQAKGGDIDLLVELPDAVESASLLSARIGAQLQMALGDQRIDVLVAAPNLPEQAVHGMARRSGQPL